MKLLTIMQKRYAGSEQDALALLSTGESPRDESLNPADLAAWTNISLDTNDDTACCGGTGCC